MDEHATMDDNLGTMHMLKNRHNGAVRNEAEAKEHEIVDDECASHVRHVGHLQMSIHGEKQGLVQHLKYDCI